MMHREMTELSSELTYHRYLLNQGQMANLFREISVPEYIALHRISGSIFKNGNGSERTYLKEIAEELHLSIPKTSKIVSELRDKGMISWGHDGNGENGTYVTITESGGALMQCQEERLKEYYGRVIERFGEEKLVTLFGLLKELERVMDCELQEESGGSDA